MSTTPSFCGECGNPVTSSSERFCGECGAPIEVEVSPEQPSTAFPPKKLASSNDSFFSANAITACWQTAVIWSVGWAPIGVIIAIFYTNRYGDNLLSNLPVMTLAYIFGGAVGGAIVGLFTYRILGRQKIALALWAVAPATTWLCLWVVSLVCLTVPYERIDDGTIIITMPILAVIFAILVSRVFIWSTGKKHSFSPTKKQVLSTIILWVVGGFISIVISMSFMSI